MDDGETSREQYLRQFYSDRQLKIRKQLMRQLEENDPTLSKLKVAHDTSVPALGVRDNYEYFPGWENDLQGIVRHTHLKEVEIVEPHDIEGDVMAKFLWYLARNRSIKTLKLLGCKNTTIMPYKRFDWAAAFDILEPFFKHNKNFESLTIHSGGDNCLQHLTSALMAFNSLKVFEYSKNSLGDGESHELLQALVGHTDLEALILRENSLRYCSGVRTFLCNPKLQRLTLLNLDGNRIADIGLNALAKGLAIRASDKKITISLEDIDRISTSGMLTLFDLYMETNQLARAQTTRQKIFDSKAFLFFEESEEFNWLSFMSDMYIDDQSYPIFPYLLAGTTAYARDGLSLGYLFVREFPSFFDRGAAVGATDATSRNTKRQKCRHAK